MTWQPGKDRIIELLRSGELEQVTPDPYQLGFDALRKSAAALLAEQGLRATSDTAGPAPDDVQDALRVAGQIRDATSTILDSGLLTPW